MNGTSGFHEVRSFISRSSTNRLLHEQQSRSEQVPYNFFSLTISSLSLQASIQNEKRLLTLFPPHEPVLTEREFIYGRAETI